MNIRPTNSCPTYILAYTDSSTSCLLLSFSHSKLKLLVPFTFFSAEFPVLILFFFSFGLGLGDTVIVDLFGFMQSISHLIVISPRVSAEFLQSLFHLCLIGLFLVSYVENTVQLCLNGPDILRLIG